MFTRSVDGGFNWSPAVRVNDDPISTHGWQWFAAMSVAPNGRIDAVWYDTRNSLNVTESELYYSYSRDGGQSWSVNQALSPPFNHFLGYPQQNKLGDYIQTISQDDKLSVAYAATFNGEQDVYYLSVPAVNAPCALDTEDGLPMCDCNENGIDDSSDIVIHGEVDLDENLVPDSCELDFDGDGILDVDDPDIDGDLVLNHLDACDFSVMGAPVRGDGRQVGDANQDCSIDATDFSLFQTCFSQAGPGESPPFRFCTDHFDYQSNGEVDLRDWAEFQNWFTGTAP
jgi:hypothetical protein